MLGHQRSPYVGRFARGWRRLPGNIPGQPQTRTRARPRIGTAPDPRTRAAAVSTRDLGARRRARAPRRTPRRWQPVVRTSSTRITRRGRGGDRRSGSNAPRIATRRSSPGRRACGAVATARRSQPNDGQVQPAADGAGERPRLVVAALGEPPPCERHPRDRVGRGRIDRDHGVGERGGDAPPPRELQSMDRARAPAPRTRTARARRSTGDGGQSSQRATARGGRPHRSHHGGASTSSAARHRPQNGHATVAAARASRWKDHVERSRDHEATVPATADIVRTASLGQIQLDRRGETTDVDRQRRLRPHDRVAGHPPATALRVELRVEHGQRGPSAASCTGRASGGVVV